MSITFQKGRLYALASVVVLNSDFEFEGNPKLNKIDQELRAIIAGQIYPTITAARADGRPAVLIQIDGPAMDSEKLKQDWKEAVCGVIHQLERAIGCPGSSLIHFSDGSAGDTRQLEEAERSKCMLI